MVIGHRSLVIAPRARRGFTLIETLVALAVLALIVGAVSGIFVSSMKFLAASSSQADAVSRASLALQEATRGMLNGVVLADAQADNITYVLPDVGGDGWYDQGTEWLPVYGFLRPGEKRKLSLSNGQIVITDADTNTVLKRYGTDITALQIFYNGVAPPVASIAAVRRVTVRVSAKGESGARTAGVTVQQDIGLFNYHP